MTNRKQSENENLQSSKKRLVLKFEKVLLKNSTKVVEQGFEFIEPNNESRCFNSCMIQRIIDLTCITHADHVSISKNIAYKIFHEEVHSEEQKVLRTSAHTQEVKHENEKTF